jgi:hypothetical protein
LAGLKISSLPEFHMDRIGSIYLAEEQQKPLKYDAQEYFVISRLEIPKDKNSLHFLDYCER